MIEANLPAWGKRELRELKRIEANLPAWVKPELRNLKRIMTTGSRQSRALARLSRELCTVFHSASPRLNSELLGRAVAHLLDSVYYADVLAHNLRDIARIMGPSKRERLRSVLMEIQEVALDGQRRQVEGLRRDIPLLLKQLEPNEPLKGKRATR